MEYAAPLKRLLAALIDWVIMIVIGGIVGVIFRLVLGDGPAAQGVTWIASILIGLGYYAGMESSSSQATVGKQAMGMIVTDIDGNPISFLRATGRFFAKYLSACLLLIGYIMILFTEKKQGLHDIIAGTLVLQK